MVAVECGPAGRRVTLHDVVVRMGPPTPPSCTSTPTKPNAAQVGDGRPRADRGRRPRRAPGDGAAAAARRARRRAARGARRDVAAGGPYLLTPAARDRAKALGVWRESRDRAARIVRRVPRPLQRDRSDGRGLPRPLPGVVRDGAHGTYAPPRGPVPGSGGSRVRLAVSEAQVRYAKSARYDDPVRVTAWLAEVASRRLVFGYRIERTDDGAPLATASTTLIWLDAGGRPARCPPRCWRASRSWWMRG